jgi:hypothetical protein
MDVTFDELERIALHPRMLANNCSPVRHVDSAPLCFVVDIEKRLVSLVAASGHSHPHRSTEAVEVSICGVSRDAARRAASQLPKILA